MRYLIVNIPSMVLGCIGGYLCFEGKDGWGFFLFVALLMATSFTSETSEEE